MKARSGLQMVYDDGLAYTLHTYREIMLKKLPNAEYNCQSHSLRLNTEDR